jgi:hypothetical protein
MAVSRNSEVLEHFVQYCQSHPQLRFWQALLNWSGLPFIAAVSHPVNDIEAYAQYHPLAPRETVKLVDTYYWEGRNG